MSATVREVYSVNDDYGQMVCGTCVNSMWLTGAFGKDPRFLRSGDPSLVCDVGPLARGDVLRQSLSATADFSRDTACAVCDRPVLYASVRDLVLSVPLDWSHKLNEYSCGPLTPGYRSTSLAVHRALRRLWLNTLARLPHRRLVDYKHTFHVLSAMGEVSGSAVRARVHGLVDVIEAHLPPFVTLNDTCHAAADRFTDAALSHGGLLLCVTLKHDWREIAKELNIPVCTRMEVERVGGLTGSDVSAGGGYITYDPAAPEAFFNASTGKSFTLRV